jgi:excisionase family DNA binding protein
MSDVLWSRIGKVFNRHTGKRKPAKAFDGATQKPMTAVQEQLLTVSDVAKRLNVSERTVHTMAQEGDIPVHRIRTCIRFDPSDVDDFVFFSKCATSPKYINLSDKEELMKRFDERNEQAKAYLESFFTRSKKQKKKKKGVSA